MLTTWPSGGRLVGAAETSKEFAECREPLVSKTARDRIFQIEAAVKRPV